MDNYAQSSLETVTFALIIIVIQWRIIVTIQKSPAYSNGAKKAYSTHNHWKMTKRAASSYQYLDIF